MILWTIQPPEVYDLIMKKGYYACEADKSECLEEMGFKEAYDWLVKKMHEKIGEAPLNIKYPVWAWHTWNWNRKKPDLRCPHAQRGRELVCMEIEIPDEDVVLTDFDSWHYVLNKWHHNYATNDEEWDAQDAWFESLPPDEKKRELEKSWENIFNLEKIDNDWTMQGAYIQATFWKLSKSQIRKVQYFKSR
ncbi:DUF3841 domain-containing protein [Thomasclavelia cocleata]|uniref:DUF3841 domain-containing protein n=1 Tax=Thomasclavelia cocleata TaxID=69824 RepID=UPI00256EAA58|nr:DUF3841 domain-containing protein [Thomasclavelia cocleata]